MSATKRLGDQHVKNVYDALLYKLENGRWPSRITPITQKTAEYIWNKFSHPDCISCKLDQANPDGHHDLMMIKESVPYPINLFIIQGNGLVQPKNLGARSFLSKYFLSEEMQESFTGYLKSEYLYYLQELLELKGVPYNLSENTRELRAKVKEYYPHFDGESNLCRDRFLLHLRDYCFTILQHSYNFHREGFMNAFHVLLMAKETNIITRIKGDIATIEEFAPEAGPSEEVTVYKKGNHSIGIHYGTVALTLRFKFENKPNSSIKLATSFEKYHQTGDFRTQIVNKNLRTLKQIDELLAQVEYSPDANISNAIGKCHEAFAYYWILKKHPGTIQADELECASYLNKYLPKIDSSLAAAIQQSSEKTSDTINQYIQDKKGPAIIEGIQLVADIYTSDRLNTGDLKISIRLSNGNVEEQYISLKAIRRLGQKITTKNPGIGTILGPTYFDLREDLNDTVAEVKAQYVKGLDRHDCLVQLSQEIGSTLEKAPQENLKRGIQNLLGKALTIITVYEQQTAFCLEHSNITSNIIVQRNTPSPIQNTLIWNDGHEQISLRVKFSSGKSHGWSSIKLTAEYVYRAR